jgi:hypothetical protein
MNDFPEKQYDRFKKNRFTNNKNTKMFFSGLKEFSKIDFYYEEKKSNIIRKPFSITDFIFNFRYAVIIFVVLTFILLGSASFIYKAVIENKYRDNLYKQLTYSYVDSSNFLFTEEDLTKSANIETISTNYK